MPVGYHHETVKRDVLDRVVCVRCAAAVDVRAAEIACGGCGQSYPRVGRIPVLLPQPHAHVELWRRQLTVLTEHGRQAQSALEGEAKADGILPDGRARVRAMAEAVRNQVDEIGALVGPAIGGPLAGSGGGLPRGVVEYGYYLHRDWGWEDVDPNENRAAVEAIQAVASGEGFGRMAVLGAGGCRLAYDLHRLRSADETVVIDIDPYLFVIAEAIVRGGSVELTESSLNVMDLEHVAARRTLRAPEGPEGEEHFHFFFANGLEPPFVDGTFDTVVTSWFIDRVPADMETFLVRLGRMLRAGGRWINQGPLLYPPETPVARRFAREEIFELARRAGFRVREWSGGSRPYLVSPLSGSGKLERLLTFEALRES
jgi:SAM-dependent methyltransferase